MAFNENTRVKIPAILHLSRLGYKYLPLSTSKWDIHTNIFTDIFTDCILQLNPSLDVSDAKRAFEDVALSLDNEDLGKAFYNNLLSTSGLKLIDFSSPENFKNNNTFHVVTELTYKNGDDEFRPDITLLINGMPLAFIEVKKPNNQEGILAERDRINTRFKNKKFRKFINLSQVLVFSNNMEYDAESIEPVQGAFYGTASYNNVIFNCFREEETFDEKILLSIDDALETFVLKDNNLASIKHSPEFITNKAINTPTNRILTSLFSKERFWMLIKYGIAYVQETHGLEKHIMRYPQFFATKAIEKTIDKGIKKGIIWHTQGSGKTALSYYNVKYIKDYFQKKSIVPKFYFIVDRIDLLVQAKKEFTSRGLSVFTVDSKEELIKSFKLKQVTHSYTGKSEITVVNIQKFKDDADFIKANDYDIKTQRIYFLDEVHRSYDPAGSFLANLVNSDRSAIMIGLTGTPLIAKDRRSIETFGDYIHKYYYNASIADGYTLKLIREDIETSYKIQLEEALKGIEILKGDADKRTVYAHDKFVEPLLDYVVEDFINSRKRLGDNTIGAMVVCDSSEQAKRLFDAFISKYNPSQKTVDVVQPFYLAAEESAVYNQYLHEKKKSLTATLILHDIGNKEERKQEVQDFKDGKIDFLFVYNMLLTGFDAKRLKKLYIGRVIKDHNLLQTLTRVNRPYKKFRYGFVVDFADISTEFDKTNKAYFEELQMQLGDEMKFYSNLFKSKEEIELEIKDIKEKLFHYNLNNAELFSQQISQIEDREKVLEIKKALENAKNLFNLIRLYGHFDLLEKVDFKKLNELYNETSRHLDLLNLKDSVQNNVDTTNLLNVALENVLFMFRKVSEEEMVIADQLKDMLRKTREALGGNFDQSDPEFVSLYDELKRLFDKKNLDEVSQDDMKNNIGSLQMIFDKVTELNRKNNLLKAKYESDAKYARLHKRILQKGNISQRESEICETLLDVKKQVDDKVLINSNILNNESYFEKLMIQTVIGNFTKSSIKLDSDSAKFINGCLVKEYLNEYHGVVYR